MFRDPDQTRAVLADYARAIKNGKRALLTGTTASAGTPEYRLQLSQKRANAVRDLLVSLGAPADRISTRGWGSDFPGYVPDHDQQGNLDPIPAAHVRQAVAGGLAYNTVQTILVRLYEKGLIGRVADGRRHEYFPVKGAEEVREAVAFLVERCADEHAAMVTGSRELVARALTKAALAGGAPGGVSGGTPVWPAALAFAGCGVSARVAALHSDPPRPEPLVPSGVLALGVATAVAAVQATVAFFQLIYWLWPT